MTNIVSTNTLIVKKILVIDTFLHQKNKQGLIRILHDIQEHAPHHAPHDANIKYEYKFGSIDDIPTHDIIYSPSQIINTSLYPIKKFIFGPHFSTFPNHRQLQSLQNTKYNNSIYIQPSEWVVKLWKNMGAEQFLPVKTFAFPVDIDKFKPATQITSYKDKDKVLIYYKHRSPIELNILKEFLAIQAINNYKIFDYNKKYEENDYLSYLKQCKYGIILDAHESQGFAIEEALACDVPLLVWNAQTMNQELNSQYAPIPCTSIPYWDERCGEYFHHYEELPAIFQLFQTKLEAQEYSPRQYILDNLSTEKCTEIFVELIK